MLGKIITMLIADVGDICSLRADVQNIVWPVPQPKDLNHSPYINKQLIVVHHIVMISCLGLLVFCNEEVFLANYTLPTDRLIQNEIPTCVCCFGLSIQLKIIILN